MYTLLSKIGTQSVAEPKKHGNAAAVGYGYIHTDARLETLPPLLCIHRKRRMDVSVSEFLTLVVIPYFGGGSEGIAERVAG